MSNIFSKITPTKELEKKVLKLEINSQMIHRRPERKSKLIVEKWISKDKKIFAKQTVVLKRLTPNEIKKYDKHFYRKFHQQLRDQNEYNKYSKLRNNLNKVNESPRMRLWTPSSSMKVSTNYSIPRNSSQLNRSLNFDEPESSLMNSSEYCRYLNLISVKEMKRIPLQQLKNSFSIRNIGRSENVKINENIVINGQTLMENMINKLKPNKLESNLKKKNRNKHKKKNSTVNKIKKKYKLLDKQKNMFVKQWREQYMKCLTTFPVVSPMGQRVYHSFNNQSLESNIIESIIRRNESYCSTKIRCRISSEPKKFNKWKCNSIERIAFRTDFSRNRVFGCHQYSFNRRQRLEKFKRFESGLNWRSRLLAMRCDRKAIISLFKTILCPICCVRIQDNHCCDIKDKCSTHLNGFKSKLKVPISEKSNDRKQETKRTKTVNKLEKSKTKECSKGKNSMRKESQNCFVKMEKFDAKKIERVCEINLDEETVRVINIDLDNEERRVVTINLDNSFQSV